MSVNLKKLMDDTLQAIADDRNEAKQLLKDVAVYLGADAARYASTGMTAAKYLEVLQRSNEQRVKLISIMKNSEEGQFSEVSEDEATELYEDFEEEDLKEGD